MKRKAVILAVVALLLAAGMTQVGVAAVENGGTRFTEACQEFWAGLTPEQQEQVKTACEEHRTQMEALREEFQARRAALREEFLSKLPAEVRAQMEERMQERMANRGERPMGMGGKGPWHGERRGCPPASE